MSNLFPARFRRLLPALALPLLFSSANAWGQGGQAGQDAPWRSVGPDGGDARAFASSPADSRRLYLGTTNSWVYESDDAGGSWKRLSKLSNTDNLILDNILVDASDAKTILVAGWVVDHPDGGLFISHDEGRSWTAVADMKGQSIRALAQSASDPRLLAAGTLKGVYRSTDSGAHWELISPLNSTEIHEVESVAIDPANPQVIYAGTWHLPWKTTDGGKSWHNIKEGLIDDSDVFSIIIDPKESSVVYTSACSGIYKSVNAGELYHKIQGIPSTARRTRVLMQDPVNRNVVYAGTTEGLYRTADSGARWERMTGPDVIVNDIYIDPKNPKHVMLATDRSGVLSSEDGSVSFTASNTGFSQRQVETLLVDARNPETIYAGVVNDKGYGGVFVSPDAGSTWRQASRGLDGRDVFSIAQSADGAVLAGTSHGIFRFENSVWVPAGKVVNTVTKTTYVVRRRKREPVTKEIPQPAYTLDARVNSLDLAGPTWYAATTEGVFHSTNQGATWQGGPLAGASDYRLVHAEGDQVYAARRDALFRSQDGGKSWAEVAMPAGLTSIRSLATTPSGALWMGGREGVATSSDQGRTWTMLEKLPFRDISGVVYEPSMKRIFVTSWRSTWVFAISPEDNSWKWWDAGWNVHSLRAMNGRLIGASLYDGVLVQPAARTLASSGGR